MAATETAHRVLSLAQEASKADDGRARIRVSHALDVGAFGVIAIYRAKAGEELLPEHDKLGPGADRQEELYVVVQGSAKFELDGEEIDAPHGTAVFALPEAIRKAVAASGETIVLAVAGRRGEAYRSSPSAELFEFWQLYEKEDYEGALAVCRELLETFPGNALILYNIACMESQLGRGDESLETLGSAIEGWPKYKENAKADDDFASLREDPRFLELVA